jgi:hypothetical protein
MLIVPSKNKFNANPSAQMPTIAVRNESRISDATLSTVLNAIQYQITNHFAPAWGYGAQIVQLTANQSIPAGAWPLYFRNDSSDFIGALGVHPPVDSTNVPYGVVYYDRCIANGNSYTVTLSHEILEMLGNPWARCYSVLPFDDGSAWFIIQENCDACEPDSAGYTTQGVLVSDFLYPAWFDPHTYGDSSIRRDYTNSIHNFGDILSGGYHSFYVCPVAELRQSAFNLGWLFGNGSTSTEGYNLLPLELKDKIAPLWTTAYETYGLTSDRNRLIFPYNE